MAESILESEAPNSLNFALTELNSLIVNNATLTKDEENHPFTECATFADDIKGEGYSFQSDWHFIDQPYLLEEGTSLSDFDYAMADVDVHQALEALTAWLKDEGDYALSTYYKQIAAVFDNVADQRSFALRLVIHYVGDIHQPLHAVSGVSSDYPTGDRGGNEEWIPFICGAGELHAVWDSVIYNYCGYPSLVSLFFIFKVLYH